MGISPLEASFQALSEAHKILSSWEVLIWRLLLIQGGHNVLYVLYFTEMSFMSFIWAIMSFNVLYVLWIDENVLYFGTVDLIFVKKSASSLDLTIFSQENHETILVSWSNSQILKKNPRLLVNDDEKISKDRA